MKIFHLLLLILSILLYSTRLSAESLKQKKINTPLSEVELAKILHASYQNVFEKFPTNITLAHGWAQIAFENGSGKKIFNNNIGNLGANKNQKYYLVAGSRFQSFDSLHEGAKAYWQFLNKRCQMALKFFKTGHTNLASNYLKRCGYYRVDEEFYTQNLISLRNKAIKHILPQLSK